MPSIAAEKQNIEKAHEYFSNKMEFTTGPVELSHMIEDKDQTIQIVDVRAANDYQKGHVPQALNLPPDKWGSFEGLTQSKTNVIYCYSQTCHLAAKAAMFFSSKGFPVKEMEGGFEAWKQKGLPLE